MANQPTKYTDEFRREAADYVISTGRPIAQCCSELGLNPKTVGKGIQDRHRELKMENAFLKKAVTFFAEEQGQPRATGRCRRRRPNARSSS